MNQIVHFEDLAQLTPPRETVLAIGVFDGVHRGHQRLLGLAVQRAQQLGCLSGAITFHPHPREVLASGLGPHYLTGLDERLQLIRTQGVDLVITLEFNQELAQLTSEAFMAGLKRYLRLRELCVGTNFALGRGREGTPDRLGELGRALGFAVRVVEPIEVDGVLVSSTAIRLALQEGDVRLAARLTGRPASLTGEVIRGAGRARSLGFPTANLRLDPRRVTPACGVYAVLVHTDGQVCPGVANLGVRPTFDDVVPTLEVHLLGFQGNLYDRTLRVDFVERLRPEIRFAAPSQLVAQVHQDIEQARGILGAVKECVGTS